MIESTQQGLLFTINLKSRMPGTNEIISVKNAKVGVSVYIYALGSRKKCKSLLKYSRYIVRFHCLVKWFIPFNLKKYLSLILLFLKRFINVHAPSACSIRSHYRWL